ncbi:MAG: hypothetical protein QFB87_05310 [Patescibacteria group bacterium]|nr:hypothetical protein [Patescibacteria group bacterium]
MRETEIVKGLAKAKMAYYARGTPFVTGGVPGGGDMVPSMLEHGEAVLPAKTVQAMGPKNIARMIEQTNGVSPKGGLRAGGGYATGVVDDPSLLSKAGGAISTGASKVGDALSSGFNAVKSAISPAAPVVADAAPSRAADLGRQFGQSTVGSALKSNFGLAKSTLGNAAVAAEPIMEAHNLGYTDGNSPKSKFYNDDNVGTLDKAKQFGEDALHIALPTIGGIAGGAAGAAFGGIPAVAGGVGGVALGAKSANGIDSLTGVDNGETAAFKKYSSGLRTATPAASALPAPVAAPAPAPAAQQAQAGTIGDVGSVAGDIQNPQPVQQRFTGNKARALDSAIRNKSLYSTDLQPGNGVVVTNNNDGSAPIATTINTNRSGGNDVGQTEQAQNNQPASPYDEVRSALRSSQIQPGDTWQQRADKISERRIAAQLGDTVNNEQSQLNSRYATDRNFDSAIISKNIARQNFQRELGNDNETRINKQLDTLSQKSDSKGAATIDPVQRADYERKVIGTYGKNGIAKADIPQDQLNEFLNYYEANKQDPGVLQKLDNFVKQRNQVESNDVTGARAVGAESGALYNSTVAANGNRTPTNLRHGQNFFGTGPVNGDLRDLDKATQAHYKKYGF